MDPITKAHIYGMLILTVLSLIIAAVYHIGKHRKTRNSRASDVKRHNQEDKEIHDSQTQAAQWFDIRKDQPTWYKTLAIITPDGVIHEGWARVCGDNNKTYYVSIKESELSLVITKITKWRYI